MSAACSALHYPSFSQVLQPLKSIRQICCTYPPPILLLTFYFLPIIQRTTLQFVLYIESLPLVLSLRVANTSF